MYFFVKTANCVQVSPIYEAKFETFGLVLHIDILFTLCTTPGQSTNLILRFILTLPCLIFGYELPILGFETFYNGLNVYFDLSMMVIKI